MPDQPLKNNPSGQFVTGCQIDVVPFLTGQRNIGSLAAILYTLRIGRADNRLHMSRVAQNPCNRDGGIGYAFGRRDLVDLLVEFREFVVIQENALQRSRIGTATRAEW